MKVGIVGGNGRMGRWFSNFLIAQGCSVAISDRDGAPSNSALCRMVDAIIVAVPIADTVAVIDSLKPMLNESQLLIDLTSVKEAPVAAMLRTPCEVLGLHPMFGPHATTLAGQTVVACRARERERTAPFLALLSEAGARIKETTPGEHDRMMAIIQGLTHFSAIAQAVCLAGLGVSLEETLEFSSPIYRLRSEMIARIVGQDPGLYADIAMHNPHVGPVLEQLQRVSSELTSTVASGDRAGFIAEFQRAADFFGDFKRQALSDSEAAADLLKR